LVSKPIVNYKQKLEELKLRDQEMENIQVVDPYSVKIRKIY
jgi:hypothetical protein